MFVKNIDYLLCYIIFSSECLDGNVTCFDDFVPSSEGHLNDSQLAQLSNLLKQFYYFENSHKESILPDIRKISALIKESESHIHTDIIMEPIH